MCDCSRMDPRDVVVPKILPLGGFTPVMCCVCGRLLGGARHVWQEGTLCGYCNNGLPPAARRARAAAESEEGSVK